MMSSETLFLSSEDRLSESDSSDDRDYQFGLKKKKKRNTAHNLKKMKHQKLQTFVGADYDDHEERNTDVVV